MSRNKNCVAMLLAGGQGSRLYNLTSKIAKPAVPFGAKYRIIDFPLSNCINSDIDTVGVLTQYQPLVLNEYIGNGQPWDLDRNFGGVHVLPPYQGKNSSDWYKGTANAIYQNINFIKKYNPKYVLILSGDHIYKMDYSIMIEHHIAKKADCTIAVIDVPIKEASRFGITNTDSDLKIIEFEEKPKHPKSNKASMGIYVFNAEKLYEYLHIDEKSTDSSKDFGKNVIPSMLANGEALYAYPFSGYWKDVGTIESLWQANMDLLGESPVFDISDYHFKIHSRSFIVPPHYIGQGSQVENSLIAGGCEVYGSVKNSVIGAGVIIEKGAVVNDSVIMANTRICKGASIEYSILDEEVMVAENAHIGEAKEKNMGIAVIGKGCHVTGSAIIKGGQMIEKD